MPEQMYKTIGEHTPDNLIAGHEIPVLVKGVTLAAGQGTVERGTVLGIATSTSLAYPVDKSKVDGSQVAKFIATDTIDTTNGNVKTTAYESGLFNSNALIFGGTDVVADHKDKLRELGIFLKENQAY
jgi:hypothetical protein